VSFKVLNLGLTNYHKTYLLQKRLVTGKVEGDKTDYLILTEHPRVITLGRWGKKENVVIPANCEIIEIERGGDVTIHFPGQLVGYPIIDLRNYGKDLTGYLRKLEDMLIMSLSKLGVRNAVRVENRTGVWVNTKKVASIGIAARRWITYHGFALNITGNLKEFRYVNPCGFKSNCMTSVSEILGCKVSLKAAGSVVADMFKEVFINNNIFGNITSGN